MMTPQKAKHLTNRLAGLDSIAQKAIKCGQLSAAAGAMTTLLRATGCDQPTPSKR